MSLCSSRTLPSKVLSGKGLLCKIHSLKHHNKNCFVCSAMPFVNIQFCSNLFVIFIWVIILEWIIEKYQLINFFYDFPLKFNTFKTRRPQKKIKMLSKNLATCVLEGSNRLLIFIHTGFLTSKQNQYLVNLKVANLSISENSFLKGHKLILNHSSF